MRRAPGWTRLAGIALELAALAFAGYVVMDRRGCAVPGDRAAPPPRPEPAPQTTPREQAQPRRSVFIIESADSGARYYRAADDAVDLVAGFYSDGRVRLADAKHRRFAGMLQGNHADLLELEGNQWSEVFVRTTPAGGMQLELRGGPYDARVLTCEPLEDSKLV